MRVFWEHARPTPQALTTPTNPLGFQELWHFDLDGLEENRESLLIADVDGDGAEELLLNTADRNRLQVLKDGRIVAEVQLQIPGRAWLGRSRALAGLWAYKQLQARANLTPTPVADVNRERAQALLAEAWASNGTGFVSAETSAQVAAAYGIPVPFSDMASTADEAVALAERADYPVVAKLIAPGVVHKADVGGIALNLRDAVVEMLRRVGQLVADFPCIRERDINPLIVGEAGAGAWAVDVRMAPE